MISTATRVPGFYLKGTRPVWWKKSRQWQARLWIGKANGGAVSLGLHDTMQAAHKFWKDVRRLVVNRYVSRHEPMALASWECLRKAWAQRGEKYDGLPKWVYRVRQDDGSIGYAGVAFIRNERFLTEYCEDPRCAFLTLWEQVGPVLAEYYSLARDKGCSRED